MTDKAKKEEFTKDELLQIVLEGSDEIIDFLKIMGGRNHLNMAADYERLVCQIQSNLDADCHLKLCIESVLSIEEEGHRFSSDDALAEIFNKCREALQK